MERKIDEISKRVARQATISTAACCSALQMTRMGAALLCASCSDHGAITSVDTLCLSAFVAQNISATLARIDRDLLLHNAVAADILSSTGGLGVRFGGSAAVLAGTTLSDICGSFSIRDHHSEDTVLSVIRELINRAAPTFAENDVDKILHDIQWHALAYCTLSVMEKSLLVFLVAAAAHQPLRLFALPTMCGIAFGILTFQSITAEFEDKLFKDLSDLIRVKLDGVESMARFKDLFQDFEHVTGRFNAPTVLWELAFSPLPSPKARVGNAGVEGTA